MRVYLWLENAGHWNQLVLFDGENTYWIDEMRPSKGKIRKGYCKTTQSQFFYIGKL